MVRPITIGRHALQIEVEPDLLATSLQQLRHLFRVRSRWRDNDREALISEARAPQVEARLVKIEKGAAAGPDCRRG